MTLRHADTISEVGPPGPGGWLRLLCVLLVAWEPVSLAFAASSLLADLTWRGSVFGGLLLLKVVSTGFGLAAGLALWRVQPGAVRLARAALVMACGVSVLVMLSPDYPGNRLPGTRWPLLGLTLAYHVAWLTYLSRSRRVRSAFPRK